MTGSAAVGLFFQEGTSMRAKVNCRFVTDFGHCKHPDVPRFLGFFRRTCSEYGSVGAKCSTGLIRW